MLSSLKKFLLFSVIIIILAVGGYFIFIRLNSSASIFNNSTKPLEEEKNWGNISGWFLDDPDLKKGWKNQGFTYDQTHDWVNVGLSPTDFPFAAWLRDEKKLSPEEVLNHENEKNLREEWINEEDNGEKEKPTEENWFGERHKLTSEEIDWAMEKIKKNNKFKILPADQFHLASIAVELTEKTTDNMLLSQLLNDIQDEEVELIFIPVKNNENHWSLLIYEKNSALFYHYDINEGINFEYSAPLLINLLSQIKPSAKSDIDEQWWETFVRNRLGQRKNDDYDSGIAVINIIQRIIQLYSSSFRIVNEVIDQNGEKYTKSRHNLELVEKNLGEFNFPEERKIWQERYLSENKN